LSYTKKEDEDRREEGEEKRVVRVGSRQANEIKPSMKQSKNIFQESQHSQHQLTAHVTYKDLMRDILTFESVENIE
jgi:hypothetical protein